MEEQAPEQAEAEDQEQGEAQERTLEDEIVAALRTIYDPEIPIDIYEMGLIYGIEIDDEGAVEVRMTLTSPTCPVAEILVGEAEAKVRAVPGVTDACVDIVWDPPWTPDRMSEAAKLTLGFL